MTDTGVVERVLRRDRVVVLGSIAAITALAWLTLFDMAAGTASMADMARLRPWTGAEAAMTVVMWAVMMVGMMLPSATPMVLLYARVCRKRLDMAVPDTGAFVMGYVAVWALFSVAATALQWGLEQAALCMIWSHAESHSRSSFYPLTGGRAPAARSRWDCATAHSAWGAAGR